MKAPLRATLAAAALVGCSSASGGTTGSAPDGSDAGEAAEARTAGSSAARRADARTATGFARLAGEITQGGWLRGTAPGGAVRVLLGGEALPLAPDGAFFAAFDRDAAEQVELVAELASGRAITERLAIAPRDWQIEHVNVARRPGGASASFMERRRPELARIDAARSLDHEVDGWRQPFIWPVKGRISGRFGAQRVYQGEPASYHSGIDIATGTSGTPFVAPADGVVTLAAETPFSLEADCYTPLRAHET